jgi:hypothetical protein
MAGLVGGTGVTCSKQINRLSSQTAVLGPFESKGLFGGLTNENLAASNFRASTRS